MWEARCESIAVFQERGDTGLLGGERREEGKDSLGTFLRGRQCQSRMISTLPDSVVSSLTASCPASDRNCLPRSRSS